MGSLVTSVVARVLRWSWVISTGLERPEGAIKFGVGVDVGRSWTIGFVAGKVVPG